MFRNLLPRNWIIYGLIALYLCILFSLADYGDKICSKNDRKKDCNFYVMSLGVVAKVIISKRHSLSIGKAIIIM